MKQRSGGSAQVYCGTRLDTQHSSPHPQPPVWGGPPHPYCAAPKPPKRPRRELGPALSWRRRGAAARFQILLQLFFIITHTSGKTSSRRHNALTYHSQRKCILPSALVTAQISMASDSCLDRLRSVQGQPRVSFSSSPLPLGGRAQVWPRSLDSAPPELPRNPARRPDAGTDSGGYGPARLQSPPLPQEPSSSVLAALRVFPRLEWMCGPLPCRG